MHYKNLRNLALLIVILLALLPPAHYFVVNSSPNEKCGSIMDVAIDVVFNSNSLVVNETHINLPLDYCLRLQIRSFASSESSYYIASPWISHGNIISNDEYSESFDAPRHSSLLLDPPERHNDFTIIFSTTDPLGDQFVSSLPTKIDVRVGDGADYYTISYIAYYIILFLGFSGMYILRRYRIRKSKSVTIFNPGGSIIRVTPETYDRTLQILSQVTPEIQIQLTRIAELANTDKTETEAIIFDLLKHHKKLGEYKEFEQVFIRYSPSDDIINDEERSIEIQSMIKNRRCCILSGRMSDKYCNICGRVVPEEYIV